MHKTLLQVLRYPFYLWLAGIYPILYLYSENFGLVIDREVLTSLIYITVATTIAFFLTNLFVRNNHKTAFTLGLCIVLFSLSGHVYGFAFERNSLLVWTLMIVVAMVLLFALVLRAGAGRFSAQVTTVLNVIVMALLAIPGSALVAYFVSQSRSVPASLEHNERAGTQPVIPKLNDSKTHPDIYYIIPDGYPSDSWLQNAMNYDNSEFSKALEDRGFTVIGHAQANYGATLLSLASILNMQYYSSNPSTIGDLEYLRSSISNSEIARELQRHGYTYIQFLSGYLFPSSIADINRDFTPGGPIDVDILQFESFFTAAVRNPETNWRKVRFDHFYKQSFFLQYLDTTLLRIVGAKLEALLLKDEDVPYHVFAPARYLATIDEVESIVSMPEATFAIVHLMKPHRPTTFNENGDIIDKISNPDHQEYFAEFGFTNSKFLQMIDMILDGSSNEAVIIFQADHGTTYGDVWTKNKRRLVHFDAYAAYYLPDSHSLDVPVPYTLINSFPLIFNELFETDLELQGDQLIELLVGYTAPFEQQDVTDIFARKKRMDHSKTA